MVREAEMLSSFENSDRDALKWPPTAAVATGLVKTTEDGSHFEREFFLEL